MFVFLNAFARQKQGFLRALVVGAVILSLGIAPLVRAIVVPATASLAINGGTSGAFTVGQSWNLGVDSNISGTAFNFCAIHPDGVQDCTPAGTLFPGNGSTNTNGAWSGLGSFPDSVVGDWIEWIQFPDGTKSNQITFTVAPAIPPAACSDVVVSDTTNLVNGQPAALVATPYNGWWTASIPGATWIWETPYVTDPTHNETAVFTKDFVVTGNPVSAILDIAADNSYSATLNGVSVASDANNTYGITPAGTALDPKILSFLKENQQHVDVLSAVHQGTNHLVFTVTNVSRASDDIYSNPAGLLYKLDVEGVSCGSGTPTSTPPTSNTSGTLIVVTNVTNNNSGVKTASDFTDTVTGVNVVPASTVAGSASGATVTVDAGSYSVVQAPSSGYDVTYSSGCSGAITGGQTATCTITDHDKASPAPACSMNGLYGVYNNLLTTTEGMEGPIMGVVKGATPFQYDWYDAKYFSFASNTPIASFNQPVNFFPVNDGLLGDPFYTAIHWKGSVIFPTAGTYPITLGSDDDSWLYINGNLAIDNGGIHPLSYATSSITVSAPTTSTIDLYFAERHSSQSGIVFQMPGVTFSPCIAPIPPTPAPSADLSITKTVSNSTPVTGSTIDYTLTVSASGNATSTNVVATDTWPGNYLTFVSATSSKGTYASGAGVWTIPEMAPSSSATLDITAIVTAPAGTSVTNTASIGSSSTSTDPNLANNTATSTITVQQIACPAWGCGPVGNATGTLDVVVTGLQGGATSTLMVMDGTFAPINATSVGNGTIPFVIKVGNTYGVTATTTAPGYTVTTSTGCAGTFSTSTTCTVTFSLAVPSVDLAITKTVSNSTPVTGSTIDYTLTVSASGNATSTNVVATDTWPNSGLTFVTSTLSKGTTTFAAGMLTWNIGTMAPNSSTTLDIKAFVTGNPGDKIANTASVGSSSTSTDPNSGNNSATSTITVMSPFANLLVTKTVNNANPKGGDTVTYTVMVSNLESASSSFVMVHDSLPIGLSINSATTTPGTGNYNSGTGDWNVGELGPNAIATFMVSVTVGSQLDGQTAMNTALVYTTLDPTTILSSSSVAIAVQPAPTNPVCTANCGGGGGGGGGQAYEIAIDGGALTTGTVSAILSLYGTGAYTMEISNSSDFSSSTWQPYATTLPWVLTSGSGGKTVYAKYRDVQGNILATVHASIDLVQGRVLGASTSSVSTSCGIYLNDYIKLGKSNDPFEVRKLQVFLNYNLGTNLPVTGTYDLATYQAVEQFQLKYNISVLSPWVPYGLTNDTTPTGYVYKTTRRWINLVMCSALNIPMPSLP